MMVLAANLVGREAQVEADHWKRAGLQRGQHLQPLTQRLHGGWLCHRSRYARLEPDRGERSISLGTPANSFIRLDRRGP